MGVLAIVCHLLIVSGEVRADGEVHIATLTSDTLTSTTRTLQGARNVILQQNDKVIFHQFTCGSATHASSVVDSINRIHPVLILTVGTVATDMAKREFPSIPIIFSSVIHPELSGFVETNKQPNANITGASLDIPVDIQFKYFKKIVPNLKRIGVLYTPETENLIAQAKEAARAEGIELVPVTVHENKDLPSALDSVSAHVDGIWSVPDPQLFTPQSTRYILLNTIRRSIPFMGFSRNVVESGALFALDFDYKAVGMQAGRIVNQVLGGQNPGRIEVSSVDVIWFHYNEKTAKLINVAIPDELVAVAKEVYR
jgi:putative ABC transport system substrate-binding protein